MPPADARAWTPAPPRTKGRICSACIMDESDPEISFDDRGVCNHCRSYVRLAADTADRRAPGALEGLVAEIRAAGKGKPYDCVIGVSGGVDSSYVALLTKRLGLRPLAVHLDNGWDAELAVGNIEKILKSLKIDLVTIVLDWQEFRDLQVAFLRSSTPDAEIPTDHAIHAALYRVASQHGIRHILAGTNVATEGGGVAAWSQGHADWRYIRSIHRQFGTRPLRKFPHYGISRFAWYTLVRRIRWVSLLDFVHYDKAAAVEELKRDLGWAPYAAKHGESRYTKFYQDYLLPRKFGVHKKRLHLSALVWSGQLSREAAIAAMSRQDATTEELDEDRTYVMKKLELTDDEFEAILTSPPKSFWDYPSYKRVFSRFPRALSAYHRLKRS